MRRYKYLHHAAASALQALTSDEEEIAEGES